MDATDNLIIGHQTTGTGLVSLDTVDLTSKPYDLEIYGGAIDIRNQMAVGGNLLVQAQTGDISVYNTSVQAGGSTIFDAQQGQFKTNMGANVFNITGGNYVLYAGDFLNSDIVALEPVSDFIYGQTSSSLPASSLATNSDFVVLRDSLSTSAFNTGAFQTSARIQEATQQPEILAMGFDVADLPAQSPSVGTNTSSDEGTQGSGLKITRVENEPKKFDKLTAKESREEMKYPINNKNIKGIGITTQDCHITASQEVICGE